MLRLLELIFFLYFLTHIPVTVLFDSQILADEIGIPKDLYPEEVVNLTKQYVAKFKDPYMMDPPGWYKTFCYMELTLQLPFFFIATFAFMLGSKRWIRTPAIIYSSHVATTVAPMLYSFYFDDFTKVNRVGPVTEEERLTLMAFYAPYFVIPVLILLTMVFSKTYRCGAPAVVESKPANANKKKQKRN